MMTQNLRNFHDCYFKICNPDDSLLEFTVLFTAGYVLDLVLDIILRELARTLLYAILYRPLLTPSPLYDKVANFVKNFSAQNYL